MNTIFKLVEKRKNLESRLFEWLHQWDYVQTQQVI